MCGIAGALLSEGLFPTESIIRAMCGTLAHRGPDNAAILIRENLALAHTRLSIVDLSVAGNQPMDDGRYSLIYNGEIYNHNDLRPALLECGVRFAGTSDSEVLFHHLIHFGIDDTIKKIRGMFAFAFYDQASKTLSIGRDRLGIKPLYWCLRDGTLYWASEIKAIKCAISLEIDPVKTFFSMASIADHSNEYTLFKGVVHLPPGSYLVAKPGQVPVVHRYYEITDYIDEARYRELDSLPFEEVTSRFQVLLERSVKGMLMSDAPMGVFVSGGVDSSLIAAIAAQLQPKIPLFTANVVGRHSEADDARLLSRSIRSELHESKYVPDMLLSMWALATYHNEVPIVTHTNAIPFAKVAQLAHDTDVKAVLTGEGADELFLGYPRMLADRYRKLINLPVNFLKAIYGIVPGLRAYVFSENGGTIVNFLELLSQEFERQQLRDARIDRYDFVPKSEVRSMYATIQDVKEHLVGLLFRNDRMGMLASIESRFPFLDEDILTFAINLPIKHKMRLNLLRFHNIKHPFLTDKAVVRETIRRRNLPQQLVQKRKNGFPMYGYKNLKIRPGFFIGGFVSDLARLSPSTEQYMIENQPPYFVAKLAAVEVFGRLFAMGESIDSVSRHVLRNASLVVAD